MSARTPGPWVTDDVYKDDIARYVMSEVLPFPRTIARLELGQDRAEQEANARLIAAAPELLEALQDLCDTLGECGMTEKARAAIAKATGETT